MERVETQNSGESMNDSQDDKDGRAGSSKASEKFKKEWNETGNLPQHRIRI
jgi:hypothetical protein